LLIHTARLHRFHLSEQLVDKGLYPGQEQVMRVLATADQFSADDLAQILQVRAPTVTKSINRLSALGLVERLPRTDSDRRSVLVRLTPKGRALAASIETSWNKVEDDLIKDFDDKDRRRLRKLLRRVSKNLTEVLGGNEREFDVPNDVLEEGLASTIGSRG
jgi:DNA-binding MarR family transcriptional regulator